MAAKGNILVNKVTGEKIKWLETSRDTNGRYLLMEFEVAPGGCVPVSHVHPNQDEYFEVESGGMRLQMKGETIRLGPGQTHLVPKGQAHQWWNDSEEHALKMRVKLEPALNSEIFFEQFFGLANDGKTKADGSPKFMQVMAMSNEYEIYLAAPPVPVQKIAAGILGTIAGVLGYKKYYSAYSKAEAEQHASPADLKI
ncbi:MAG TPA: cupin domain-containing protein [Chitinophagaceae bacterium]